jgi:hypothetical protein
VYSFAPFMIATSALGGSRPLYERVYLPTWLAQSQWSFRLVGFFLSFHFFATMIDYRTAVCILVKQRLDVILETF